MRILKSLADLYAIGVVGAIAINMLACGTNKDLDLARWERVVLLTIGTLIALIELTIAYDKPKALMFAAVVVGVGLTGRVIAKREWRSVAVSGGALAGSGVAFYVLPSAIEAGMRTVSHVQSFSVAALILGGIGTASYLVTPAALIEEEQREKELAKKKHPRFESAVRKGLSLNAPRILMPTRGNPELLRFAVNYAKDKQAVLFFFSSAKSR